MESRSVQKVVVSYVNSAGRVFNFGCLVYLVKRCAGAMQRELRTGSHVV
jgi:hypothetical protein